MLYSRCFGAASLSQELGAVSFEFDSGGPSRIEAWLPTVSASNVATVWQPDSEAAGLEAAIDQNRLERLVYLQNKAPKWDEAHGGHVLNFQVSVSGSLYFPLFHRESCPINLVIERKLEGYISKQCCKLLTFLLCVAVCQGRVTESSVKNFQLCCPGAEDGDQVALQFGRVGKHKFTMDLRFPLSPMQVGRAADGPC